VGYPYSRANQDPCFCRPCVRPRNIRGVQPCRTVASRRRAHLYTELGKAIFGLDGRTWFHHNANVPETVLDPLGDRFCLTRTQCWDQLMVGRGHNVVLWNLRSPRITLYRLVYVGLITSSSPSILVQFPMTTGHIEWHTSAFVGAIRSTRIDRRMNGCGIRDL
jgi:hypothetical protein